MADRPSPRHALLPAPIADWPVIAFKGQAQWPDADVEAALARIRSERLWWPQPRHDARAEISVAGGDKDLSRYLPDAVERIEAPLGRRIKRYAIFGGLVRGDASSLLAASRWVDPWRGADVSLAEGIEALSFLAAAARRNRGGFHLIGMSPWKQRCLTPFLTGPDGPPGAAGRPVIWGAGDQASGAPPRALRVEDGFLRSVGLGLRHTPPASLTFDDEAPYFDATRRNGFEDVAESAIFDESLLARAAALRARILALRLSKYNVGGGGALPDTNGREAVLVPGQVETDASIRLGGAHIRTNRDLLIHARETAPDAFLVYKPHPDVLTGLREGAVEDAADIADHVETAASPPDCLDWADRVVTITSLMGFEALLRDKRVTTLGRPFYAGWGLTDDIAPPARGRALTLDELTAAALILYPRYIDPVSGLPAPPEVTVEALAAELSNETTAKSRLRRVWRNTASWVLNRI